MLRQRFVRQSAVNINSSSESNARMPSPPPIRKRRGSQDAKMYKQLSSDSMDNLILASSPSSSTEGDRSQRVAGRRHSVAGGVLLHVDMQRPTLKSAFNSAVRRMSDACSLLSSAPSSTYNLSTRTQTVKKKDEVMLPQVLGTFRQDLTPKPQGCERPKRGSFQINRRYSTDCPPPSYTEAVSSWKQSVPRQKLLTRQSEVVTSKSSLVAVEDDDCGNIDE